uniref:Uncharacterized protein n=1 Tax=Poecilia reticulata TaxID=8081 RepID=A0A3P9PPH1_POERE
MISYPKAVSGRTRRNRQRPGAEKRPCSDASPQKRRGPERSSKKQTQNAIRPPTRTSETVTDPHESLPVRNKEKKKSRAAGKRNEVQEKKKESRCRKASPPATATKPCRKRQQNKGSAVVPHEKDGDEWTEDEILKLQEAVSCYPRHVVGYWAKVARMVGTRSAEECYKQHTSQGNTQSPKKSTKNCKKVAEKPAGKYGCLAVGRTIPVISARVGTLKRIKQVRQFLENLPRDDVDDAFSSAYMQNKRMEIPSLCSSEDHDFAMSDLEPQTPMSSCFPEAKTPQCLHITPGMLGSPNT